MISASPANEFPQLMPRYNGAEKSHPHVVLSELLTYRIQEHSIVLCH